jgi:putative membrane protein
MNNPLSHPGTHPENCLSVRSMAVYSAALLLLLTLSALGASEMDTWAMEVAPIVLALPVLWATHRRFPLTPLLYGLIFVHALILMLGGHYTYAKVPLGFWMQDAFGLSRNPYDGIGHLAQGFVPAIVVRELLLRLTPLRTGGWLMALVIAVCGAISALYELIEWGAAVAIGSGADAFLGTQGDPWDTQKDMAFAFVGAILALVLLPRWHDGQLARITGQQR